MRNSFGKFAEQLRLVRGLSQTEFAGRIGEPIARVSSMEHGRIHISDSVISRYIQTLDLSGHDALELRRCAGVSNSRRDARKVGFENDDLHALIAQFAAQLSPRGIARLRVVLEEELGPKVAAMKYSSDKTKTSATKPTRATKRIQLDPRTLVRIALKAESIRNDLGYPDGRLNMIVLLERYCAMHGNLDIDVLERLPAYADGAFACIVGEDCGNVILVEEERCLGAARGNPFQSHVLAHEFGHHILHHDQIKKSRDGYMPPQELAKLSAFESIDPESEPTSVREVIDTIQELEAECFATMLLVPWRAFIKGTSAHYLAKDYGEQSHVVRKFARYFQMDHVLDEFRKQLFDRGESDFPKIVKPTID